MRSRMVAAALAHELARADVASTRSSAPGSAGIPEDEWADAIDGLNEGPAPVVAVDIPSGVNGATGAVEGDAVRADVTVTFGAAKVGAVLLPGAEYAGAVRVVDIGFPDELVRADAFLVEPSDVAGWLPTRPIDTHKRATGRPRRRRRVARHDGSARRSWPEPRRGSAPGSSSSRRPPTIVPTIQTHLTEATFAPAARDGVPDRWRAKRSRPCSSGSSAPTRSRSVPGLTTDDETAGFVRDARPRVARPRRRRRRRAERVRGRPAELWRTARRRRCSRRTSGSSRDSSGAGCDGARRRSPGTCAGSPTTRTPSPS